MSFTAAGFYSDSFTDSTGRPLPSISVSVLVHGTNTLATLYTTSTKTTPASNPITTDSLGNGSFYADPGVYDVKYGSNPAVPIVVAVDPAEAVAEGTSGGTVASVNGYTGTVVLAASDVGAQPVDSDLTAIAALSTTSFGRSLLALADAAAGRIALGLGTAATQASTAFDAAGAAAAAQAASQPLDSDLTAIAALSTTSFGRALLTLADATAGRTAFGLGTAATAASTDFQPVDTDLTAIAALSTTSYGRSFLALADAAAGRTALGLGTAATAATTDFDAAGAAASEATARAAADALLAPLASPTFTGVVTAPVHAASGITGAVAASRYAGATASGAPASGTFLKGDFVIDQTAKVWVCTAAGSPGTWAAASGTSQTPGLLLAPTTVKTANYTAAAGDFVPCDVSGGGFTVTLPTAPADKTTVGVKMVVGGNTLTVATGGSDVINVAGGATSGTLKIVNQGLLLQYKATGAIWYIVADDLPYSATTYEVVQALGNTGTAKTIDATSGTYVTGTLTGNCTFTFPSPTSGLAYSFTLELTQDATGSRTVTWPAAVKWAGGTAPTLTTTAAKVDIFSFVTRDGGTTWHGFTAGQNFAA